MPRPEDLHPGLEPHFWVLVGRRVIVVKVEQMLRWLKGSGHCFTLGRADDTGGSGVGPLGELDVILPEERQLTEEEIAAGIKFCEEHLDAVAKLRQPVNFTRSTPPGLVRYGNS